MLGILNPFGPGMHPGHCLAETNPVGNVVIDRVAAFEVVVFVFLADMWAISRNGQAAGIVDVAVAFLTTEGAGVHTYFLRLIFRLLAAILRRALLSSAMRFVA
jgi:hypothetical protein